MKRIGIGGIAIESYTFSPIRTERADSQPDTKESLIFREGVAWEAHVRFYKDRTGLVKIPGRAKKFTIEKVASEAAANL